MDNMSTQWDKTHLCKKYNEDDCEFFLQTGSMETVLDGHKLAKCSYYCTSENKVRKIGSGGTWTGLSPKFCPKRKAEKGETDNMPKMNKRCQELLADNTALEPQEDKLSETDKPTYKDVLFEHYPDFDISRFEEFSKSVCVACCFMDDNPKCTFEDGCEKHWESECLFKWRDEPRDLDSEDIGEYLNSANDNADTETADLPSPPLDQTTEAVAESSVITARAETVANTFNYAVLTAEMGDFLKRKEQQLKNEYMNFTANCGKIFAEAREKLAKHGFGENNGVFESWIKSMGFSKPTVYRMIDIYNFRSSQIETNEGQVFFDTLPKTLQMDISAKSAPPELVKQVMNGDITTHKDYIALKKELERTREECRQLDTNSAAKDKEYKQQLDEASERVRTAEMQSRTYKQNYLQMEKKFDEMSNENIKLEKQIKELKSRPHATYYDVDEVNRRVEEAASKLQNQTAQQIAENHKTYSEKIDRMQSTIDDLENKLAEANAAKKQTDVKIFAVKLTLKNFEKLLHFIDSCDNAAVKQAIKKAEIIKID